MRIGLIGTYDVDNFGDCAFSVLYEKLFRKYIPEAEICLYSPTVQGSVIIGSPELIALPSRLGGSEIAVDLMVLTGGDTLSMGHGAGTYIFPSDTLSPYLRLWLAPLHESVRSEGKSFVAYCVGAKRDRHTENELIGRALEHAAYVRLRDAKSARDISTGAVEYKWAVDPMFLFSEILSLKDWEERRSSIALDIGSYIVCQISPRIIHNDIIEWVTEIEKIATLKRVNVILLPICHFFYDSIVLEKAQDILKEGLSRQNLKSVVVPDRIHVMDTAAIIGGSEGYIGSSLHGAVVAASFGKPVVCYSGRSDGKHGGTLGAAGIREAVASDVAMISKVFLAQSSLDYTAIAQSAKAKALSDFEELIGAIGSPIDRKRTDLFDNIASEIVEYERSGARSFMLAIKKLIFSFMRRRVPSIFEAYSKFRVVTKIGL